MPPPGFDVVALGELVIDLVPARSADGWPALLQDRWRAG